MCAVVCFPNKMTLAIEVTGVLFTYSGSGGQWVRGNKVVAKVDSLNCQKGVLEQNRKPSDWSIICSEQLLLALARG